ncbi:MAG: hypothetical protein DRJ03_03225 [Chloroflexi bacterium]|nr:MAG: hypothetical protein DRJ03_03225 [Chloroflexota bacterium]
MTVPVASGLIKMFWGTRLNIGGVTFDGILSTGHENTLRITTNPIEFGADVADHAVIEPRRITVVGIVSDHPLSLSNVVRNITGVVESVGGLFNNDTAPSGISVRAYADLREVMESRIPLTLETNLANYDNMMLVEMKVDRDKETSKVAILNMVFQEVFLTYTDISLVSVTPSVAGVAAPTTPAGSKSPLALTKSVASSWAKNVKNFMAQITSVFN